MSSYSGVLNDVNDEQQRQLHLFISYKLKHCSIYINYCSYKVQNFV